MEPEQDSRRAGRSYYRFELDDCPKGLEGRGVRCIAEVRVDLWNDRGQRFLSEELGVQGAAWWTSIGDADPKSVVMLYHDHATMEQHHGELKTDLGIERLPSGKFETNRLYLQLAYVAMTVLRLIGDKALQCDPGVSPRPRGRPPGASGCAPFLNATSSCPAGLSGPDAGSRSFSATSIPTSRPSRRFMPNASP